MLEHTRTASLSRRHKRRARVLSVTSVPRVKPPSTYTSSRSNTSGAFAWSSSRGDYCWLRPIDAVSAISAQSQLVQTYVSSERPPWLLSRIASAPYCTALRASAAVWIPLSTRGSSETRRIHAKSSHESVESMYLAITRPRPPPFLSFFATAPLTAETRPSAARRSSASRLPGMGASTVTNTALTPSFFRRSKQSLRFGSIGVHV